MIPTKSLPLNPYWSSTDEYVDSLLAFVTTSDLLRNLCGGVHILDFLTRKPDLYSWVLPEEWRSWFDLITVDDLHDLLMREDLDQFKSESSHEGSEKSAQWRGHRHPPASLIAYIDTIRIHSLDRSFQPARDNIDNLPRHIAVGMKPKKAHEVMNFAAYIDQLSSNVSENTGEPLSIIDFGSGQNYLGRTLACPPYDKHVIAIERKHHNVEGAREMDVLAKLTAKEKIMRNKKEYKRQLAMVNGMPTPPPEAVEPFQTPVVETIPEVLNAAQKAVDNPEQVNKGTMTYIEQDLVDGHLEDIIRPSHPGTKQSSRDQDGCPQNLTESISTTKSIVVSIHSCGNLTHHGLRSLTLNPSVRAVAMIGCCYNLLTERLGPPTFKHPQLRSNHPRLEATSTTYDPHGFPMSKQLELYEYDIPCSTLTPEDPSAQSPSTKKERGVRLNITARMMAVQAPYNWGPIDSRAFFTRHFYRALLQRILLDRGVVKQPSPSSSSAASIEIAGGSQTGKDLEGTPLIIGSLRKAAFTSFPNYVEAALTKLWAGEDGEHIKSLTSELLEDEEIIKTYEEKYGYAEKNLAIIWSLMAFSAGVVESLIVVDRWLWLKEQDEVEHAWVQTVFGYELSPRNLAVIGVKKSNA